LKSVTWSNRSVLRSTKCFSDLLGRSIILCDVMIIMSNMTLVHLRVIIIKGVKSYMDRSLYNFFYLYTYNWLLCVAILSNLGTIVHTSKCVALQLACHFRFHSHGSFAAFWNLVRPWESQRQRFGCSTTAPIR
jgi:hypothetical protein